MRGASFGFYHFGAVGGQLSIYKTVPRGSPPFRTPMQSFYLDPYNYRQLVIQSPTNSYRGVSGSK